MQIPKLGKNGRLDVVIVFASFLVMAVGFGLVLGGTFLGNQLGKQITLGGGSLFLGTAAGLAAYGQLRYEITSYHESRWPPKIRFAHKSEMPGKYWFTTVLYLVLSVSLLVFALLTFLGDGTLIGTDLR